MATPTIVTGSLAPTPTSIPDKKRVNPKASAPPAAIPSSVNETPSRNTMPRTVDGPAPSAIRTPISWVRRLTANDITPRIPVAARIRPISPTPPNNDAPSRGRRRTRGRRGDNL